MGKGNNGGGNNGAGNKVRYGDGKTEERGVGKEGTDLGWVSDVCGRV